MASLATGRLLLGMLPVVVGLRMVASTKSLPSTVWMAPVMNAGGFSSEVWAYVGALQTAFTDVGGSGVFGLRQFAEQADPNFAAGLSDASQAMLRELLKVGRGRRRWDVAVCHSTPDVWHADGAFGWGSVSPCPPPGGPYAVGRAMYETDRVPANWVGRLNKMDEIWVPSHFALAQFESSGVHATKLVLVPEAVDTEFFDPKKYEPTSLGHDDVDFRFLSIFKWEKRKGWDVLLRAYFEEFSAEDSVAICIKTQAFHSDSDFKVKVRTFVESLGTTAKRPLARYGLISEDLPLREFPRLYRSADAFVLPTRGEGWGRPLVEAMSMGLPVIATNWSGSTEFMSEAYSLPLRIDGLEDVEPGNAPEGHRWAVPSVKHLRSLMRWAVEHREEAQALGVRAREAMIKDFSPRVVVEAHVLPLLRRIAALRHKQASEL